MYPNKPAINNIYKAPKNKILNALLKTDISVYSLAAVESITTQTTITTCTHLHAVRLALIRPWKSGSMVSGVEL